MKLVKLGDDSILFIPVTKLEVLSLWFLSWFVGEYSKCWNPEAYPMNRRLKLERIK